MGKLVLFLLIVDGRMIVHCSTRIVCWDLRLPTTI
jgi:hypothetical protein